MFPGDLKELESFSHSPGFLGVPRCLPGILSSLVIRARHVKVDSQVICGGRVNRFLQIPRDPFVEPSTAGDAQFLIDGLTNQFMANNDADSTTIHQSELVQLIQAGDAVLGGDSYQTRQVFDLEGPGMD